MSSLRRLASRFGQVSIREAESHGESVRSFWQQFQSNSSSSPSFAVVGGGSSTETDAAPPTTLVPTPPTAPLSAGPGLEHVFRRMPPPPPPPPPPHHPTHQAHHAAAVVAVSSREINRQLSRAESLPEVLSILSTYSNAPCFNTVNVTTGIHRLAKTAAATLSSSSSSSSSQSSLQEALVAEWIKLNQSIAKQLEHVDAQGLANAMWANATLKRVMGGETMRRMARAVEGGGGGGGGGMGMGMEGKREGKRVLSAGAATFTPTAAPPAATSTTAAGVVVGGVAAATMMSAAALAEAPPPVATPPHSSASSSSSSAHGTVATFVAPSEVKKQPDQDDEQAPTLSTRTPPRPPPPPPSSSPPPSAEHLLGASLLTSLDRDDEEEGEKVVGEQKRRRLTTTLLPSEGGLEATTSLSSLSSPRASALLSSIFAAPLDDKEMEMERWKETTPFSSSSSSSSSLSRLPGPLAAALSLHGLSLPLLPPLSSSPLSSSLVTATPPPPPPPSSTSSIPPTPGTLFLSHLVQAMHHHVDDFSPQAIANILWALAALSHPPPSTFLSSLLATALPLLPQFEPQHVSISLYALASLHIHFATKQEEERILTGLAHRADQCLVRFRPNELANLLWGLSRLVSNALLAPQRAARGGDETTPAETPSTTTTTPSFSLSSSLAASSFDPLLSRLAATCHCKLPLFSRGQNIGHLLSSFGAMRFYPGQELLRDVCREARARGGGGSGGEYRMSELAHSVGGMSVLRGMDGWEGLDDVVKRVLEAWEEGQGVVGVAGEMRMGDAAGLLFGASLLRRASPVIWRSILSRCAPPSSSSSSSSSSLSQLALSMEEEEQLHLAALLTELDHPHSIPSFLPTSLALLLSRAPTVKTLEDEAWKATVMHSLLCFISEPLLLDTRIPLDGWDNNDNAEGGGGGGGGVSRSLRETVHSIRSLSVDVYLPRSRTVLELHGHNATLRNTSHRLITGMAQARRWLLELHGYTVKAIHVRDWVTLKRGDEAAFLQRVIMS